MRSLVAISLFTLLFLGSRESWSKSNDIDDMRPLESEKLSNPILLPHCAGIRIVEWRGTPGYHGTYPSAAGRAIIDRTCRKAIDNYQKFIKILNLTTLPLKGFHQDICLMPARVEHGGTDFRNLNDSEHRFLKRNNKFNLVWGWTSYEADSIYLLNEVLDEDDNPNERFITIFSHEMFHAMAEYGEIYVPSQDWSDDEKNAVNFTIFLGLGK